MQAGMHAMRQFEPGIIIPHDLSAAPFFAGVYGGQVVIVAFIDAISKSVSQLGYVFATAIVPAVDKSERFAVLPGPICMCNRRASVIIKGNTFDAPFFAGVN